MDFEFNDLQRMLKDGAERFVEKEYGFEQRRQLASGEPGFSDDHWATFAELGWLGLTLPESSGGFGGSAGDTLVLMEAFGRGLVLEPYLPTAVLGGVLLPHLSEAGRAELIDGVVGGRHKLALAFAEPQGRYDPARVQTVAERDAGGYLLSGKKAVVLGGHVANFFVMSARTGGGPADRQGISLFLVPADAPGLTRRSYRTLDGGGAAELRLDGVSVGGEALIGVEGDGLEPLEQALDAGIAAVCAEAVGCMAAVTDLTVEYLKTRKQFGMPIGAFQALQHRAVDMFVATEQSRSMAYMAAVKVQLVDAGERRRHLSAAKQFVSEAATRVAQEAVQLHGGIGVTDEYAASHYFKRLTALSRWFGDARYHLARFAALP